MSSFRRGRKMTSVVTNATPNVANVTTLACDEVTFRRFLVLGTESTQYSASAHNSWTEGTNNVPPTTPVINSLNKLREEGRDNAALKHIKDVNETIGDLADRQAIMLSLANLVRSQSSQETPQDLVEVEREEDGSSPSKKSRRTDPSYEARQLVLEIFGKGSKDDEVRMFYRFYNTVDTSKGHCGRGMRRIMQTWYNQQSPYDIWRSNRGQAYHKGILKRLHYKPVDKEHAAMAKYLIGGVGAAREFGQSDAKALEVVEFLNQINQLNSCKDHQEAANIIRTHRLRVGAVPHELFNSLEVWIATFPQMSLREVLYNLERLSKHGFLASKDNQLTQEVLEKLKTTEESFKFAEIYILYKNCASKWKSSSAKKEVKNNPEVECAVEIVEHLKDLSYKLLKSLPQLPGRRVLVCVDVRRLTKDEKVWCASNLTCSEVSALVTLALANSGCGYFRVVTWSGSEKQRVMSDIEIDKSETVEQIEQKFDKKFGELKKIPIDPARPLIWARETDLKLDSIVVLTGTHTYTDARLEKEINEYRQKVNPKLRYIYLASACKKVPVSRTDPLMLDIAGFDEKVVTLISAFIDEKF